MFATIYLPNFYLQAALRHQPELSGQPVALIDDLGKKGGDYSAQCGRRTNRGALRNDAEPGFGAVSSACDKNEKPSQEKLLQDILLHFAGTLAPYVEATGAGISTIQFTDTQKLWGKRWNASSPN